MKALPADVRPYRRTPEFTESTIPPGLLRDHRTKAGVWGVIHVLEGELEYRILEPTPACYVLRAGDHGVVEPATRHQVRALGPVRFFVEFYAVADASTGVS